MHKTGMLAQVETIELVASYLAEQNVHMSWILHGRNSGDRLIEEDAIKR